MPASLSAAPKWLSLLCVFVSCVANAAPPEMCTAKNLRAAREKANALLKQDPVPLSSYELERLWNACKSKSEKDEEVQWLASDLAYFYLKTNQNGLCEEKFCKDNTVDCRYPREKQPWDKKPSQAQTSFQFNVTQCLKVSESGMSDDELANDYKSDRKSLAAICKKSKVFRYVRFKKVAGEDDDKYVVVVGDSEKAVKKFKAVRDGMEPSVYWAGDLNGDGLTDLLINHGSCSNEVSCPYELLVSCGSGKYAPALPFDKNDFDWMYDPRIMKSTTTVDGEAWRDIQDHYRHRNMGSCENTYDFVVDGKLQFDGLGYKMSAAETAKVAKAAEDQKSEQRQACAKEAKKK